MRHRNLLPTGTKLQLFKDAILAYLTYCHLVWRFCRASDCRKLKRIQESALRAIFCDRSSGFNFSNSVICTAPRIVDPYSAANKIETRFVNNYP